MVRGVMAAFGLALLLVLAAMGWLDYHTSCYDYLISRAAARNSVDFYLVKALIFEESWFRSDVRGPAGELGLMQLTTAAASDFAAAEGFPLSYGARLLEPELNVEIGCWYLGQSIRRYEDSPAPLLFALLRYNAGESRADAWLQRALSKPAPSGVSLESYYLSVVTFPKTRAYVGRILRRFRNRNFWF